MIHTVTPITAIEAQLSAADHYSRHWRHVERAVGSGDANWSPERVRDAALRLGAADPYFVSGDIDDLIYAAAEAFELDAVLPADVIPDHPVWIYLEQGASGTMPDGRDVTMRGFVVSRSSDSSIAGSEGAGFEPWSDAPDGGLAPHGAMYMGVGDFIDGRRYAVDGRIHGVTNVAAWYLAFVLFTRQRLLRTDARVAPSRAQRRRWSLPLDPLVRVVQLRGIESSREHSPGASHEYHCRWIRRGHWHGYWCGPKDGEQHIEPRWLLPQVVGPADKPLKARRATLYAVVR